MNFMAKGMLGAVAILAAGTLAAQTTTFNTLADWNKTSNLTEANGVFTVKNSTALTSVKKFDIDPAKTYTLKASIKNDGTEKSMFYLGFNLFDKNNRTISNINVAVIAQTDTELVAPAKKGDTTIKVKNGAKWQKHAWYGFAYNTDPSYSDLPNFNIQQAPVKEIIQQDNVWVFTLAKPLTVDLAAGTKVRQHSNGGYMYTGGYGQPGADWKTYSGSASGLVKTGYPYAKFAPGTAKVQVIMLVNWTNPKAVTQVKDISLEVK